MKNHLQYIEPDEDDEDDEDDGCCPHLNTTISQYTVYQDAISVIIMCDDCSAVDATSAEPKPQWVQNGIDAFLDFRKAMVLCGKEEKNSVGNVYYESSLHRLRR